MHRTRSWMCGVPSIGVCLVFFPLFTVAAFKVGWKLYRGKERLVNRLFFEILRLAFRDLKRDKHGRNAIYGMEIGRVSFALLIVMTVPVILSACFITFWNIYLVEEQISTDCNINYDCFPILNGKILQSTPVQNCSHVWPQGIVKYKCYQLVYSYVQGLSATGGLLFFTSVMLKIYTATLLAPHNIQNIRYKWICYFLVLTGGSTVAVLFILLHTIPHSQSTVLRTATLKIQFVVYTFLLFVVFFVTGPLLIFGIECESQRRGRLVEIDCSV